MQAERSSAWSFFGNTGSTPRALETFQPQRCGLISMTIIALGGVAAPRAELHLGRIKHSTRRLSVTLLGSRSIPLGLGRYPSG